MGKEITIKGNKDGLLLNVQDGLSYEDFLKSFKKTIMEYNSFFSGGNIVGINNMSLNTEQKEEILNFMDEVGGIKITSFEYKKSIREPLKIKNDDLKYSENALAKNFKKLGSEKSINNNEEKARYSLKSYIGEDEDMAETVFYRGTVRSGTKIESKSHILIVGDVNPGAELIANGNIVVMGILRGLAHAGADGSTDKIIAAWKLKPTQLRIADYITMPPDGDEEEITYPEMAIVESGRVIIKSYQ